MVYETRIELTSEETKKHDRLIAVRRGSALIWAMIIMIALIILIGVMAIIVQTSHHGQKKSQTSTQAYYTARSVNEVIANWLDGTAKYSTTLMSDQYTFIEDLKAGPVTQSYSADDLDPSGEGKMGTAEAVVSINSDDPDRDLRNTVITIKVTGRFAGVSETIVSTLRSATESSYTYQDSNVAVYGTSTFDPAVKYGADVAALTTLPSSEVQIVGDLGSTSSSASTNEEDLEKVSYIGKKDDTEVMWRSGRVNSKTDNNSTVQGTKREPDVGRSDPSDPINKTSKRRVVAAKNGRFLINPIQVGDHGGEGRSSRFSKEDAGSGTNTRFTMLSMDTSNAVAAGTRNIRVRIANAGMDSEVGYNALMGLDFVDITGAVKKVESGFESPNLTGTKTGPFEYHPIDWDSCDIFVPGDANLGDTNLIIGMYGHKYANHFSYWSWGNYVNNWIGIVPGEYQTIYPEAAGNRPEQYGLNNIPVSYDKTRVWCLDGDTDRYFRILQGVSIIGGAVYSNRPTIIGGGLLAVSGSGGNDNKTTDHIDNSILGYVDGGRDSTSYCSSYVNSSVMYDQIFENTDFVFMGNGAAVSSTIRRPNTWEDRSNQSKVTAKAKTFNPNMVITGGSIYVGKQQALTIQGAVLNNMMVAPSELIVASGAALTVSASSCFNVKTDIFVQGKATIEAGAKAGGNISVEAGGALTIGSSANYNGTIYVASGGAVTLCGAMVVGDILVAGGGKITIAGGSNITGDVRCAGEIFITGDITVNTATPPADNPDTVDINEADGDYHGIFVYNVPDVVVGNLTLTGSPKIAGNSGKIHTFVGYPSIAHTRNSEIFCNDCTDGNACLHWTSDAGVWSKQNDSGGG